jgi:nitrite reductase/ring-hydroxylating ferredoxin subunit
MDVGALSDLAQEGRLIARVGGREVGVVGAGGELHALRNRCPHHGGPLCLGTVRNREAGAPGRYQPSSRIVLRCPWHGWEFDLESGRCLDEPAMRVAVYDVRVEGGRVLVEV